MSNYKEYLKTAIERSKQNPNWRWGQTLFNTLVEVRPDLAELIRGDDKFDCFYSLPNSEKIINFLSCVENSIEFPFNKGSIQPNILDLAYWTVEKTPQFDSKCFLEDCQKWLENNNPWNKNDNIL